MDDQIVRTDAPNAPQADLGSASTRADNRAVMHEFARLLYTERDVEAAFTRFVAQDYVQHNPGLGDGRDAAVHFLKPLFGADGGRFDVQRILVDGDLATVHVRARPAGMAEVAVADFYRLSRGLITEHWDVIQPVPDTATNDHPMF